MSLLTTASAALPILFSVFSFWLSLLTRSSHYAAVSFCPQVIVIILAGIVLLTRDLTFLSHHLLRLQTQQPGSLAVSRIAGLCVILPMTWKASRSLPVLEARKRLAMEC